jgi:ribosome maturation factor RimP
MGFKEKVEVLLQGALDNMPSLFLINLEISAGFKVLVTLDGDNGVTLQDCIDVSRAIEHNLDREEQDFSLEVASAGVSSPLKLVRQYKKNLGRELKVTTATQTISATLTNVNDQDITLEWEAREPKKIGKGKETVLKRLVLPYSEIKEAVVTITF